MSTIVRPGLLLSAALYLGGAAAQINYVATEIAWDDREFDVSYGLEDINGDGRQDLILPHWQRTLGRELWIYEQLGDGRFSDTPRRIEIKTEIVAVGFADLRPEPGKELVLFAGPGLFTLSTAIEGYAGNLQPLVQWQLAADVPAFDTVELIRELNDIDGDGLTDLLLPGPRSWGYFRGDGTGGMTLSTEFTTLNPDLDPALQGDRDRDLSTNLTIDAQTGIRLEVSARRPSPFADLVQTWQADQSAADGTLLEAENWMPAVQLADLDGDGREDMVYLNTDTDLQAQLNLHRQRPDGSFPPEPDWHHSVTGRGNLRITDLDGDAFTDLVRLEGSGDQWDAFLFRNRNGSFDLAQPDQVMRFSGYDATLSFIDIDGDGRPELNVSYYTIPVVEAIRNTAILRTQLLYSADGAEAGQLFSRRPLSRLEESFSATNVRGLAEQMSLRWDVDGDGRKDALYITEAGAVAARRIDTQLRIEEQPFWTYVPDRSVIGFFVRDLNGDDVPDLVLRHGTSITLLVARP
jgi:hypothetical protein